MGNTVILTKSHPAELGVIEKAEAFQISMLDGPTGEQRLQEQHGWWDEQNQKAQWLVTTLAPELALPFEEASRSYFEQIGKRASEGFVHARSFNFKEGRFEYRNLSDKNVPFRISPQSVEKIRGVSQNAHAAEIFFEKFVSSVGGIKLDSARTLSGAPVGGADYLFPNRLIAELKILEKDKWDDYNQKMDNLFDRYRKDGLLSSDIDQETASADDPEIPEEMKAEWYSILLAPIQGIFWDANRQIAVAKGMEPNAQSLLLLLNIHNRLHGEPSRLFWLVRDKLLTGSNFPNIDACVYFSLPVPELMNAGVNKSIFWSPFTRPENETSEGWKDQNLWMKCRGLEGKWQDFLTKELGVPIYNIPPADIRWPKP
jgi:hypothetical protein